MRVYLIILSMETLQASDEEIGVVAQNAGVNSFSEELDQKLHTVIGENG